jgi:holo-[acyl-carrier protein] synthase
MEIAGIGTDIQMVSQFEQSLKRQGDRFLNKIFTPFEIAFCEKHRLAAQHFAVRWAVKEAFYKAVSDKMKEHYRFVDVETRNSANGKPYLQLYGSTHEFAVNQQLSFHISLSHSGNYAVGFVIALQQT